MVVAMQAAMDDGVVPSVGGTVVTALPLVDGLAYSCGIRAFAGGSQSIPSGVHTPIEFGQGPEKGSFTEAVMTPLKPGVGAIGIHIREARSGALHWPSRFPRPVVYRDLGQSGFREAVLAEFGLELSGPTLT